MRAILSLLVLFTGIGDYMKLYSSYVACLRQ